MKTFADFLKQYYPLLLLALALLLLSIMLIPGNILGTSAGRARAVYAAFIFGALVGVAEIASRYRDEPLKAVLSPFGLIYEALNGFLSVLAIFLIFYYEQRFETVAGDPLLAALTAGFGAAVVMRTRIAVLKSPDGTDIAIGPDQVITTLLQVIDTNIDRWRAVRRQTILRNSFDRLRDLGEFEEAWTYLGASMLAFQNLDDAQRKALNETYNDYKARQQPDDIKRLGVGFIFLTLVGETNFDKVLECAAQIRERGAAAAAAAPVGTPPTPPVDPAAEFARWLIANSSPVGSPPDSPP